MNTYTLRTADNQRLRITLDQLHGLVLRAIPDPQLEQSLDAWLNRIKPATPAPLRSFRWITREPAPMPSLDR